MAVAAIRDVAREVAEGRPGENSRVTAPVRRSPSRVLHVLTRMHQAGTERNVLHFIEWERAAGYDVELAVGAESSFVPTDIRSHRLRWLVRAVNPLRDAMALRELRFLV